nr:helix-turn-helix domain-containing protein [Cohnella lubricantis]
MVLLAANLSIFYLQNTEKETRKDELELIKERLLNILISNELILSDDEMNAHLNRVGISIRSPLFQVAVVEIDKLHQTLSKASESLLWQFAVSNILNEIITINGNNIVFNGTEGRIISILQFDNEEDWAKFNVDQFQRLYEVVTKYLKFTITVGVGRPVRGFKAVHSSYIDAVISIQNKFIMNDAKVIEYTRLESNGMNVGFYPREIHENLLQGLKLNDLKRINEELSNVFALIKERRLSADYTLTIFVGLVSLCLSHITELGKSIEDVFGKEFSPYAEVRKLKSMESSFIWFSDLFEQIIQYSTANKLTKSKILVKKVMDYIENNLQNNELDLEMISKNVFVNSSYLTKTFKKEVGLTVTNYITSIRMQRAKKLLTADNAFAISRIAEIVGYSDVSYFSKSFKKYTGVSPSEYENVHK